MFSWHLRESCQYILRIIQIDLGLLVCIAKVRGPTFCWLLFVEWEIILWVFSDQVMKHCPLSFAFALLLGSFCWKHHFQFVLQNSRMVLGLEPPDVIPGVMVVYIEKGNLQI